MKISVIIPAYNAGKTLEASVLSVTGQAYPELEVILVDDGSVDNTGEVCGKLAGKDQRIRVIRQENRGVSAARNRGLDEAQGDAVLFLDADDMLLPGALSALAAGLAEEADVCCGRILRGTEKETQGKDSRILRGAELIDEALVRPTDLLTVHGWLFRRDAIAENRFHPDLKMGEDSELVLRVLNGCRGAALIPDCVYRYTIQPDSAVHAWKPGQTEQQYLKMLEVIGNTETGKHKNWPLYVLTTLLLILTHDTFHPANPASRREQFAEAKRLLNLPVIAEAFEKADLESVKDQRRIVLQWLKAGRILPAWVAVKIRQKQNARNA